MSQPHSDPSQPTRSRPWMPGYGIEADLDGLLDWSWAESRLSSQHNYWICSTGTDGAPHASPVWGVWVSSALFFSTGVTSRKYRNLTADGRCVVAVDRGEESLTIEGSAEVVGSSGDAEWADLVGRPYLAKYHTDMVAMNAPVFRVTPVKVIAQIDRDGEFTRTATRWTWPPH